MSAGFAVQAAFGQLGCVRPESDGAVAGLRNSGWEADERPEPRSLGLLPSGPDPVGEWLVHRQPPIAYIGRARPESKRGRFRQPQRFDSVRKSLRFGKASDLHRRLASFAIRVIYPAVLSIALSGLAAAQHDDRGNLRRSNIQAAVRPPVSRSSCRGGRLASPRERK